MCDKQCFQNAYYAAVVRWACKMFMKSTPVAQMSTFELYWRSPTRSSGARYHLVATYSVNVSPGAVEKNEFFYFVYIYIQSYFWQCFTGFMSYMCVNMSVCVCMGVCVCVCVCVCVIGIHNLCACGRSKRVHKTAHYWSRTLFYLEVTSLPKMNSFTDLTILLHNATQHLHVLVTSAFSSTQA